jgi:hypothetical protein
MTAIRRRVRLDRAFVLAMAIACAQGCLAPPPPPPPPPPVDPYVASHIVGRDLVHGSGDANALNIVILGDGFTDDAASLAGYRAAAAKYVENLLSTPPFTAMQDALNIYRVDVISDEAGIDVPESCGTGPGAYVYAAPPAGFGPWARRPASRSNALETTWCPNPNVTADYRFLTSVNETRVWNFALEAGVSPDFVIVLVNDWMYGATAWVSHPLGTVSGGIAYSYIARNLTGETNPGGTTAIAPQFPGTFPAVAIHETGHLGPFVLLDEYGDQPGPIPSGEQAEIDASPNLTSIWPPLKWAHLKSPSASLPTNCSSPNLPDVGAVLKGNKYGSGVYHSRCECRMDAFESKSFCVVCREQFLTQLAVGAPSTFSLRVTLDSVRLLTGVTGDFFIDYKFVADGVAYAGRWPSPTQPFLIHGGTTEEPGSIFFEVPPSATLGPTLSVDIGLVRSLSPLSTPSAAVFKAVTLNLPPSGTATIVKFEPGGRGTRGYRLTLGVVRR